MNRRKWTRMLPALLLAAACFLIPGARADKYITLTFTGDCTIGSEEKFRNSQDSFDSFAKREGYSWFFANFRDMFSEDDCTVINLEGVLYDSSYGEKTRKGFRFRSKNVWISPEMPRLRSSWLKNPGSRQVKLFPSARLSSTG